MENEDDDVQDIYVDQDEDEQDFLPREGDVQSMHINTQRGEMRCHLIVRPDLRLCCNGNSLTIRCWFTQCLPQMVSSDQAAGVAIV